MKKLTGLLVAVLFTMHLSGHGGEDHSHTPPASATVKTAGYFTSESVSDKYEVLAKYEYLEPGAESVFRLFLSEYHTNKPVTGAKLNVSVANHPDISIAVSTSDSGIYILTTTFPEKEMYDLNVSIDAKPGADLILVKGIEPGKHPEEEEDEEDELNFFQRNPYIGIGAAFVLGLIIMFFLRKPARNRTNAIVFAIFILSAELLYPLQALAHEGHDEAETKGNTFSADVIIPKETQFLFGVLTATATKGNFSGSTKVSGTVIPASNGQALLSVPQNGKITSLQVAVGDKVKKGQQLATAELQMDPGTMVNLLAEKNAIDAEYLAAKANYDRLISIKDIAAQKDITEAEARLQRAEENKKLLDSKNGRVYLITSPIDGVVGNFNAVIGSPVLAGESIFTVTNLDEVYVEALVFDRDAEAVEKGSAFSVQSTYESTKITSARLISRAQTITASTQSQRVLFSLQNPEGQFKIGEFVNVFAVDSAQSREIALPGSALTEINGKQAVFVKESAEVYSLVYVTTGMRNEEQVVITSGIEEGNRVVINAAYQLKMIYLNQ